MFFLKMLWFLWTLPVLSCSAGVWPAIVYTLWHRGETERGQSPYKQVLWWENSKQPTDRPTDRTTDIRSHWKVTLKSPITVFFWGSTQRLTYRVLVHTCFVCMGAIKNDLRTIWSPYKMIAYKMNFVHNDRFRAVILIYSSVHIDRLYQFEHLLIENRWIDRNFDHFNVFNQVSISFHIFLHHNAHY